MRLYGSMRGARSGDVHRADNERILTEVQVSNATYRGWNGSKGAIELEVASTPGYPNVLTVKLSFIPNRGTSVPLDPDRTRERVVFFGYLDTAPMHPSLETYQP